ncbi:hypothetical protein DERF_006284 [Dermatophagoides farinae]|uniref:Uncharacterized protein n=1 Tax=Dermatophagoides farinae TaxID=6954 RepID=A0A922I8P4_DERFA|nr:hypothetical protein DERF_006284 [Dermatophagoides farinae]
MIFIFISFHFFQFCFNGIRIFDKQSFVNDRFSFNVPFKSNKLWNFIPLTKTSDAIWFFK